MTKLKWSFAFMALAFVLSLRFPVCTGEFHTGNIYFQFVQQWQPTACRYLATKARSAQFQCRASRSFTIHGLWPSIPYVRKQPYKCGAPWFDANAMSTRLVNKLKNSWPDLLGQNMDFWLYEWNTHGTCSVKTYNQTQYFERANEMWNQAHLTSTLRSFFPTNPTTGLSLANKRQVAQLIHTTTTKIPLLSCFRSARVSWLWEVVICYTHDGTTLMDCPQLSGRNWCPTQFYL